MEQKININVIRQEEVEPVKLKTPRYNKDFSILSPSINSDGEVSDGKRLLPVYVNQDVYDAIWKHARCDMRNEVGGALIGFYCRDKKSEIEKFLVVTDVLNMPPEYFKSPSLLRFTDEFLIELDEYMEHVNRQDPELRRLGFYHTHPGYGVFLSGTDIRTFKGIFKEHWQIAMVVDPVNKDAGVFYWQEGMISPKNGFYRFKSDCMKFQLHKAANSHRLLRWHNRHSLESPPQPVEKKESTPHKSREENHPGEQRQEETKSVSGELEESINGTVEKQIDNANDSEPDSTSDSDSKTADPSTQQSKNDKPGKDSIKRNEAAEDNQLDDEAKKNSDQKTGTGQGTEDKSLAGDISNAGKTTHPTPRHVGDTNEQILLDEKRKEGNTMPEIGPQVRGLS
jgi:proteasome lid subunit RPN8/RPN11